MKVLKKIILGAVFLFGLTAMSSNTGSAKAETVLWTVLAHWKKFK